jgi:hypothetical protein
LDTPRFGASAKNSGQSQLHKQKRSFFGRPKKRYGREKSVENFFSAARRVIYGFFI